MTAAFVNATLAPAGEILRTWQFMVELRLLNAMTPPKYVRERADFRLSNMQQLHSHFAQEYRLARRQQRVAGRDFALALN
jgi:hypothetical protein